MATSSVKTQHFPKKYGLSFPVSEDCGIMALDVLEFLLCGETLRARPLLFDTNRYIRGQAAISRGAIFIAEHSNI